MRLLNTGIMAHPLNWLTVTLMVMFGIVLLNLLMTPWHSAKAVSLSANSEPLPPLQMMQ
jgi:hypothetical protein